MLKKAFTSNYALVAVLGLLVIARFLLLDFYPLMDTTEARYAEIARKMLELNDWVTPWFDYNVPFWGKPPLSFWVTAISFKWFGISELNARLPHFLAGLFILWWVWRWTRKHSSELAVSATIILATSLLFTASSGLVMTDMWLLLGVVMAMTAFWDTVIAPEQANLYSSWWFFLGLVIGLLSKGPVVLVFVGVPIFVWVLWQKAWWPVWQKIPWVKGGILTLLLALPWFVMAEIKTPGFLEYFILGEHVYRFVIPGWEGDLYGTAHEHPKGAIWGMLWIGLLPWSILVPMLGVWLWLKKSGRGLNLNDNIVFLLLWGLTPVVFFSFAGNILWPYVLPGLPALAVLIGLWLNQQDVQKKFWLLLASLMSLTIILGVSVVLMLGDKTEKKSQKSLIHYYQSLQPDRVLSTPNPVLYYLEKRPFSASFYSQGKALRADSIAQVIMTKHAQPVYIAMQPSMFKNLSMKQRNQLEHLKDFVGYQLFRVLDQPL